MQVKLVSDIFIEDFGTVNNQKHRKYDDNDTTNMVAWTPAADA
jgi:hypothetical protein